MWATSSVVRTFPGITTHPFQPWGCFPVRAGLCYTTEHIRAPQWVQLCQASHSHHTGGVHRHLCSAELPGCL